MPAPDPKRNPHLQFQVYGTKNAARHREINFDTTDKQDRKRHKLDPYGWHSNFDIDPWAYQAYPDGALSVNLSLRLFVDAAPSAKPAVLPRSS